MYAILFYSSFTLHSLSNIAYFILAIIHLLNNPHYIPNQIHFVLALFSVLLSINKVLVISNVGIDTLSPNHTSFKTSVLSSFTFANISIVVLGIFTNIGIIMITAKNVYFYMFIPILCSISTATCITILLNTKRNLVLFNFEQVS